VNGTSEVKSGDALLDVLLEGGPADMPEGLRTRRVADTDYRVKVPHRGGYEHFERDDEPSDSARRTPVVFHWTMRTRIAE
jgi:hypothetical protein